MIFGIDSHKATLALAGVDPLGRVLLAAEFPNDPAGHRALLAFARKHAPEERRFGIEATGSYAYALARTLVAAGERVAEVPPGLADRERRRARAGKSDAIDAAAIARVAARGEGLAQLAEDPAARDLKLLADYRDQLMAERTRTANRLHADLIQLRPGYQVRCPALRGAPVLRLAAGLLRRALPAGRAGAGAPCHAAPPRRRVKGLERRLAALVRASGTRLTELPGVGPLIAARIIGEVRDVARYANRDRFAMANGTAPLPASSGNRVRHRLNRGGNRRLNWAIHLIALTQARCDPRARAYLARRRAEGRTGREAIRALKRHLSDVIYRQLVADARAAALR